MHAVEVECLVKRFPKRGGAPVTAVNDVSFAVPRGAIVGLLGPNGAGKSTTIKMLCGLIRPDAGRATVMGHDVARARGPALRHLSAVLEGNRNLYWRLTVRENLEYFAGNRGRSRRAVAGEIDALLQRFGLVAKEREVVNALSRGMQQKLALAVAMLAGTEVVLLDEPTLGLDVETGLEVRRLLGEIAAAGRTVIVSTHDMPVVQALCERTIIIAGGSVVTDARVSELMALFETRGYTVRLGAPAGDGLLASLRAAFPVVDVAQGGREVRVDLPHGEDVYRLVDLLREARAPLASLDRTGIHFEEVFQRVVRGERGGLAAAAPAAAAGEVREHGLA